MLDPMNEAAAPIIETPGRARNVPGPPKFETVDQERRHRKERLAAAFRLFAKFGFDEGVAGHITVRDPERPDCFWVNPFGVHFGQIHASDLILVDHTGAVIEGASTLAVEVIAIRLAVPVVGSSAALTGIMLGVVLLALSAGYWRGDCLSVRRRRSARCSGRR